MITVTDSRSNPRDQIAHAVETIGRSKARLTVFQTVYRGKKRAKSVNEIAKTTGLPRIRVLQEGKKLADNHIVVQLRLAGLTAYEKDRFYSANKAKIVSLVRSKKAFERFHTKTRPATTTEHVTLRLPVAPPKVRQVTIDDIDGFSKVRSHKNPPVFRTQVEERVFKNGVARILGESGEFQDWGGESNDLYTTRTRLNGRRIPAAFAFKGPGKKGILTPAKMGKNGNQIQHLFRVPAELYVVQYWSQIGEDVVDQLHRFATAKAALEGSRVFYAVIDGDDTARIISAYPSAFRRRRARA